jgi:hypothetical protein
MALVAVNASREQQSGHALHFARIQLAFVSRDAGLGHPIDLFVGDRFAPDERGAQG